MSNTLTTSFSYSVNGFRQYAFAISPSSSPTPPSIVGSPSFYSVNASGATFSTSVTVPSGSNRVLFVVATWWYGTPGNATFGGVAMNRYIYSAGGLTGGLGIFWLANPTASTDTVLITLDTNPGTNVRTIGAFTTQGTDQTIPINNNADSESSGVSSTSVTCSPIVNYSFLFSTVSDYGFSGPVTNTTDGSQSELWNAHTGGTTVTTSGSTKNADIVLEINVLDTLTISEEADLNNPQLNISNLTDSLTVTENVGPSIRSFISKTDTISVIENLSITPPAIGFSPFLIENETVVENISLNIPIDISLIETLTITENFVVPDPSVLPIQIIYDILTLSEFFVMDTFKFTVGRTQLGNLGISL